MVDFIGYPEAPTPGAVLVEHLNEFNLRLYSNTMGRITEISLESQLFNKVKWETVSRSKLLTHEEHREIENLTEFTMNTAVGPVTVRKGK